MKKESKAVLEGLLFAAGDEGLTKKQLSIIMEEDEAEIERGLELLKEDYQQLDRGISLMTSNEVFHLTTKPDHSHFYTKMMETPQASRLSQAALETLAIIAYRQPITRTEIEEIRGVKSERPVRTLLSRYLVEEKGRKEGAGRPILYGTSTEFLTYFGLRSIDELPPLTEDFSNTDVEVEADLFFKDLKEKNS